MSGPAKKPLSVDDVEQAIREILRVATLWAANRRDGVSPSAMAYHEKFLRAVTEAALQHWDKLPLKKSPTSKDIFRSQDFRSYAVLMHVMAALERFQDRIPTSGRSMSERDLTELAQYIQVGLVVLGRDGFLRNRVGENNEGIDGIEDIKMVLRRLKTKLGKDLRRTAGTIVHAFEGTSGTKLFKVRDTVEQEGPEDLEGSSVRPLIARRRLEEQVNGRHVSFEEIRAYTLRLLGISAVSSPQDDKAEDGGARPNGAIDRHVPAETFALVEEDGGAAADDLPPETHTLVEQVRRQNQAIARHLARFPSSRRFPLIGDDDIAPLVHQPPKRVRALPGSRRKREE
jgi:hypothetical protein